MEDSVFAQIVANGRQCICTDCGKWETVYLHRLWQMEDIVFAQIVANGRHCICTDCGKWETVYLHRLWQMGDSVFAQICTDSVFGISKTPFFKSVFLYFKHELSSLKVQKNLYKWDKVCLDVL